MYDRRGHDNGEFFCLSRLVTGAASVYGSPGMGGGQDLGATDTRSMARETIGATLQRMGNVWGNTSLIGGMRQGGRVRPEEHEHDGDE